MTSYEEKIAAGRIPCCVPGCRRTFAPEEGSSEIMCGDHWRTVPAYRRRRHRALIARYRRLYGDTAYWLFPAGSPKLLGAVKLNNMCAQAWRLIKKAATERALGI